MSDEITFDLGQNQNEGIVDLGDLLSSSGPEAPPTVSASEESSILGLDQIGNEEKPDLGSLVDESTEEEVDDNLSEEEKKKKEEEEGKGPKIIVEENTNIDLGGEEEEENADGSTPKAKKSTSTTSVDYKSVFTKLSESNNWEAIEELEIDGEVVKFEDVEMTDEIFYQLIAQQTEESKEALLQDRVSTSGISDFTKQLIEIEKNGGNVNDAIRLYNTVKNPLENLDITNPADAEAVVYMGLKYSGVAEEEIDGIISVYKTQGIIEDKAEEYNTKLSTAYQKQLDQIEQNAKTQKQQRAEQLAEYKKGLGESLKTYNFAPAYTKKLLDLATKEVQQGNRTGFELDSLYREMRNDPKKSAELLLFLADPDEYKKVVTSTVKAEVETEGLKRAKIIRTPKSDSRVTKTTQTRNGDIDLSSIPM